jgi:hypothetical protein
MVRDQRSLGRDSVRDAGDGDENLLYCIRDESEQSDQSGAIIDGRVT